MPLILLLVTIARAHPMGSDLVGHRLRVQIDAQEIAVELELEIPTAQVLRELRQLAERSGPLDAAAQKAWMEQRHRDLDNGLLLRIDGRPGPAWTAAAPVQSGVGDERFVAFRRSLRAPLPEGVATINLIDLTEADRPGLFSMELLVAPEVRLEATSLVELREGRAPLDHSGQWRADEAARELRVAMSRRPAPLALGTAALWRLSRPAWVGRAPAAVAMGLGGGEPSGGGLGLSTRAAALGLVLAASAGGLAPRAEAGRVARWAAAITAIVALIWGVMSPAAPALPVAPALALAGACALAATWAARRSGWPAALDPPGWSVLAVGALGGPAFAGAAGLAFVVLSSLVSRRLPTARATAAPLARAGVAWGALAVGAGWAWWG